MHMFLRKNKEIRIKAMKPYIEVDRRLSREEYEKLLNELFTYIDYFKHTYENNDFKNGEKSAYYLIADTLKCQILNDNIKTNLDIKKYVDEILNLK